jgi:hypothetical protein
MYFRKTNIFLQHNFQQLSIYLNMRRTSCQLNIAIGPIILTLNSKLSAFPSENRPESFSLIFFCRNRIYSSTFRRF